MEQPGNVQRTAGPTRTASAKANGVNPALLSASSEAPAPHCNGASVIDTDLAMMAGVATTCDQCERRRFQAPVLDHHLGGRDISELAMSVTEAGSSSAPARRARRPLTPSSPGSPTSGRLLILCRPLTTLSGDERRRLKLAARSGFGRAKGPRGPRRVMRDASDDSSRVRGTRTPLREIAALGASFQAGTIVT